VPARRGVSLSALASRCAALRNRRDSAGFGGGDLLRDFRRRGRSLAHLVRRGEVHVEQEFGGGAISYTNSSSARFFVAYLALGREILGEMDEQTPVLSSNIAQPHRFPLPPCSRAAILRRATTVAEEEAA